MNGNMKRAVLIGIDGAEAAIIEKMASEGHMPNLKFIMETATCDDIDGYVQEGGQGWASIVTGKSPQKHGVYYWTISSSFDSRMFDEQKAWHLLNAEGLSTGIVNVSYTFPPEFVDGFMISGLGAGLEPGANVTYSYPEDLIKELDRESKGYIWGCKTHAGSLSAQARYLSRIIAMTEKRGSAADYLLEKYNPDFFMIEFRGVDAIQHIFWNLLGENVCGDLAFDELRHLIYEYYNKLDKWVGHLWNKYPEALTMIISDHGFTGASFHFFINEFLHTAGYLYKRKSIRARAGNTFFGKIKQRLHPLYNQHLTRFRFFRTLNQIRKKRMPKIDIAIDWEKTSLVAKCGNGLWFNERIDLSVEERNKIGKSIKTALLDLRDPFSGNRLFKSVIFKCDKVPHNHFNRVPDITFELNHENFQILPDISLNESIVYKDTSRLPYGEFTGKHRRFGFFAINRNSNNHRAQSLGVKANDILPTVLAYFGVNIPEEIDGRVLEEYLD